MASHTIPQHLFDLLTRNIPDELKTHQECLQACEIVLDELKTPSDIHAVCVHEAGHFIYAIKFGVIVGFEPAQIRMRPPFVEHYVDIEKNEHFSPVPGSIWTPFEGKKATWTVDKIWSAAQVAVAGGVFAGELANRPDKGAKGDEGLLKTYYRLAHRTLHNDPRFLDFSEYWRKAKKNVEDTIKEYPVFLDQAKRIGEEYKAKHFGPYLAHCQVNNEPG